MNGPWKLGLKFALSFLVICESGVYIFIMKCADRFQHESRSGLVSSFLISEKHLRHLTAETWSPAAFNESLL